MTGKLCVSSVDTGKTSAGEMATKWQLVLLIPRICLSAVTRERAINIQSYLSRLAEGNDNSIRVLPGETRAMGYVAVPK